MYANTVIQRTNIRTRGVEFLFENIILIRIILLFFNVLRFEIYVKSMLISVVVIVITKKSLLILGVICGMPTFLRNF